MAQNRRAWMARSSFTRLANATPYSVGDAVSDDATTPTALNFAKVARFNGGTGIIRSLSLYKSDQDLSSATFDILLFTATPAAAGFRDNLTIAVTDAEYAASFVGRIEMASASGQALSTGDVWTVNDINIPYRCATNDVDLYGVVRVDATYTPASGEVFNFVLGVEID